MSRSLLGAIALCVLLALTGATFFLSEHNASNYVIGGLALAKAVVICGVFLEMDRSWPGWTLGVLAMLLALVGGAAALIGG